MEGILSAGQGILTADHCGDAPSRAPATEARPTGHYMDARLRSSRRHLHRPLKAVAAHVRGTATGLAGAVTGGLETAAPDRQAYPRI